MKLIMSADVQTKDAVSGEESTEYASAEFDIVTDGELDTALKQWDKVIKSIGLEEESK